MKNKKDTIPILYPAGGYGTFLEWCIAYFSGSPKGIDCPWGLNGNSHGFSGNHLINFTGWTNYLASDNYHDFVKFHPKAYIHEVAVDHIINILDQGHRVITLFPTTDDTLLVINNKFDKLWSEGWLAHNQNDFLDNLKQWGIESLNDAERWQIREFLSFYITPQHLDETEAESIEQFHHQNLHKIPIRNLFTDFKSTILSVFEFIDSPLQRSNFEEIYNSWVSLQKHTNKDQEVNHIVDSVVNQIQYGWEDQNLTVVDEAIIQMKLRDLHSLNLKCYNLNTFPSNTTELLSLLSYG